MQACEACSCARRKCFSTAWRISSDSRMASASVSIRNQAFPPAASHTNRMAALPRDRCGPILAGSRCAGNGLVGSHATGGRLVPVHMSLALNRARCYRYGRL